MIIRVLDTDVLPAVPWKNGGGVTRNVAVFPEGADFNAFVWRVSIADVAASGPFSLFPGVDRTIVMLEGDGMLLAKAHGSVALNEPFAMHEFAGEEAIDATLIGGPTRDFNLMVRRGTATGRVVIAQDTHHNPAHSDHALLYCARGEYHLPDGTILGAGWAAQITNLRAGAIFSSGTPGSVLLAALIETRPH